MATRSDRKHASMRIASLMVIAIASFVLVTTMIPIKASAATIVNLDVYGYVIDSAGYRLEGAAVSVSVTTGGTGSDTTDSDGRYYVSIDPGQWDLGDTVTVTAVYNSDSKINQTVIDQDMYDIAMVEVWVQYEYAIPEFGSYFGVVVVGVTLGAVALLSTRRKRN